MSRNLYQQTCYYCDHPIMLLEKPRPITEEDAFGYFKEFKGMVVAIAYCPVCLAKYLAWVDTSKRLNHSSKNYHEVIQDLSFLSTFNDEPGPDDLPAYKVEKRWIRVGDYDG